MLRYFPFFFNLSKLSILVVGGGDIALSKVRILLKANPKIHLVAPQINAELSVLLEKHASASLAQKIFEVSDLTNADLVVVATNDESLNKSVWQEAKRLNKLVNVVDQSERCDFIFASFLERGDLTIAISTGGIAPVVANWFRMHLEQIVPQQWGVLMRGLANIRPKALEHYPDSRKRRTFYHRLLSNSRHRLFQQTSEEGVSRQIESELAQQPLDKGKVYLVGAGPGDPELITLKGHRLLQQADVILYDRLVSEKLLDLSRREAKKIFVGKSAQNHHKKQSEINELLLKFALAGNVVVRLKGGDPFIFGRGGEELQYLERHNVEVDVIPGISAANGAAASFGIPLTHRGVSDQVTLITAYQNNFSTEDWQRMVSSRQTLVLYMSLATLSQFCQGLLKHGAPEHLHLAIIEKATWESKQKCHRSTIGEIIQSDVSHLVSPVVTIIGEVTKPAPYTL